MVIQMIKWEVWALINEPLDSEKTLIIFQEICWGGDEHKMKKIKQKEKNVAEEREEKKEMKKQKNHNDMNYMNMEMNF